jgi:hypothetical protein
MAREDAKRAVEGADGETASRIAETAEGEAERIPLRGVGLGWVGLRTSVSHVFAKRDL